MSVDRLRLGVVRIGVSVLVAGAVVGVAGCTGKDPAPMSTSTTSSTTTTSPPTTTTSPPPTTGATDLPAAAKAHTPAGAEAFVRYFVDQLNRSWTGPDSALLSGLCDKASKSCAAYQKTARELSSNHQHYDRAPVTITSLSHQDTIADAERFVAAATQNEAHVIDAAGAVVTTDPQQSGTLVYYVHWEAGRWIMQDVKVGA